MLYFSRAATAAILLTTLMVCGFAVPNFLPDQMVKSWPAWAQRRLVLGHDLQGGTFLQLEVDRDDVRAQILESLSRDVWSGLREARIDLIRPVAVRGGSVEVRPLESSFKSALAKLGELSQSFGGVRPVDVVDAGGGLIRVTPTDAALAEREQRTVNQSMPIIERRINEIGLFKPTVWSERPGRIAIEMPGVTDPLLQ